MIMSSCHEIGFYPFYVLTQCIDLGVCKRNTENNDNTRHENKYFRRREVYVSEVVGFLELQIKWLETFENFENSNNVLLVD